MRSFGSGDEPYCRASPVPIVVAWLSVYMSISGTLIEATVSDVIAINKSRDIRELQVCVGDIGDENGSLRVECYHRTAAVHQIDGASIRLRDGLECISRRSQLLFQLAS